MWLTIFVLLLASSLKLAASSPTRILSPLPASSHPSTLTITIALPHSLRPNSLPLHLCFSLTNRRVSWHQYTHCTPASSLPTAPYSVPVNDLPPGAYRLRSYLSVNDAAHSHDRGGHDVAEGLVVGSDAAVFFTVDTEAWLQTINADASKLRRFGAVELSDDIIVDEVFRDMMRRLPTDVVVLMSNYGHRSLLLNALYTLSSQNIPALVFALSPELCYDGVVAGTATACYTLSQIHLKTLCGDCGTRDVWGAGFADVAVIKPAVVRSVLASGKNVVWMDTDVVVLGDFWSVLRDGEEDVVIQASSGPGSEEIYFREELCTGFYYLASNSNTIEFITETIRELARREEEVRFGDQASFNLVLWEWAFRSSSRVGLKVAVLNPVQFPTGALFFDYHDVFYGAGQDNRAVIVHNNYLIGVEKKVDRFKRHGMWFEDRWTEDVLGGSVVGMGLVNTGSGGEGGEDYFKPYERHWGTMHRAVEGGIAGKALCVEEGRGAVELALVYGREQGVDVVVVQNEGTCGELDVIKKAAAEEL